MSTTLNSNSGLAINSLASLGDPLRSLYRLKPAIWVYSAMILFVLVGCFLVAQSFDDRLLLGVSVWTKPFKFALSLGVYFITIAIYAQYMPERYFTLKRGWLLVLIPTACALFEIVYITLQASQGETSHFNSSSAYHATMYSLMGLGAVMLVSILVWMAFSIARNESLNNPVVLAIVIGLLLTFFLGGGLGGYLGNQSGHWVGGVTTDANGSWLFNWARDGGDLRVAHFFGMHAMQVIPIVGLLVSKRMNQSMAIVTIVVVSCTYTALTLFAFYQALNAQPFLA